MGHAASPVEHADQEFAEHVPLLDIRFVIPGKARGKGRARAAPLMRNGKPVIGAGGRPIVIHHTPEETEAYESLVRIAAAQAMGGRAPTQRPVRMDVEIVVGVAKSWSGKRQRDALAGRIRPTGKPDMDNVAKALLDGFNTVVFADDAQVVETWLRKAYGEIPQVVVRVRELAAEPA